MNTTRKWSTMLITILAALMLAAAAWSATRTDAQAVDEAWKKGMEAGDLDAVVSCYAEEATLWLPGAAAAHGRSAIREVYRGLLEANAVSDVSYSRTRYRAAGSLQAGAGDFSLVLTPKSGGAPIRMSGRFSTVVEKERGRWVYAVDHASSGPTP